MTRFTLTAVALVAALALVGCGTADDKDVVEKAGPKSGRSGDAESPAEQGQLLEYGFGQEGQYVQAVAVVKNASDHGGQTVTVSVNFLDAAGTTITTESQVDSFNYAGQTTAVVVFADLGDVKQKVASIEPTLLVEDEGTFEETEEDFGTADGKVKKDQFGSWTAKFTIANPTAEPLKSPHIGVACKNASGDIIGGGFDFPDLVPPNGDIVIEPDLTVSGKPAECTAYIAGPVF